MTFRCNVHSLTGSKTLECSPALHSFGGGPKFIYRILAIHAACIYITQRDHQLEVIWLHYFRLQGQAIASTTPQLFVYLALLWMVRVGMAAGHKSGKTTVA